jgi:hypothetical protein
MTDPDPVTLFNLRTDAAYQRLEAALGHLKGPRGAVGPRTDRREVRSGPVPLPTPLDP